MPHGMTSILLYFFVLATGASGLIFQVAWQKYLSRLLGSDNTATAIILATFLGGLSLGYYLCGKLTTRVKNHFKAYAILEGIIALWCLSFPTLFSLVHSLTRTWDFSPPLLIIVQGMICSAGLMAVPTICMGGTIPFLTRALSKNVEESTGVHARVYATNTAGAFAGTLLAGFFLVPALGLPLTVMGAALLNVGASLFFYLISLRKNRHEVMITSAPEPESSPVRTTSLFPPAILYSVVFLSGFYVMTLENILIRFTNLSLGSSSYSFTMIVSVFILSIAIGSFAVGRIRKLPGDLLFFNQLLITLLLLLIYLSLDTWPYWAHLIRMCFQSNMAGFWAYYACVFLVLTLVLILPVSLMGATVPITFHELKRDLHSVGKHSGTLFSLNTAGNLTGSLAGGIVLFYIFNNAGIFLTAVCLAALSTCLAAWHVSRKYFLLASAIGAACIILVLFTPLYEESHFVFGTFRIRTPRPASFSGPSRFLKEHTNFAGKVKYYNDGPSATVAVTESRKKYPPDNQKALSIIINGKSDSNTITDIDTIRLLAHIPALLARQRKKVMVIGIGTGVSAGQLALYPDVESIDIAEISPSVIEALPYFSIATNAVHKDPRVTIHMGDAFRVLGRSSEKWDIVISEPSNPWVTGIDLLYTLEFYRLVREHLSEDGMLLQWTHLYSASPAMVGMIVNTARKVFENLRVFHGCGSDIFILASMRDITPEDLERAEELLNDSKGLQASLQGINIGSLDSILLREIWPPSYLAEQFSGFGIQTLDNPRLHYLAGKRFFIGASVPDDFLFNWETARYLDEYLMVMKHPDWRTLLFEKEEYGSLLASTRTQAFGQELPMAAALKLKAYLGDPSGFPLSGKEKKYFRVDLIPLITGSAQNEEAWKKAGLAGASLREKAAAMIDHTSTFKNWIVPYPTGGLQALLKRGIQNGKDACEKNWFRLQLAHLLIIENGDTKMIKKILDRAIKGKDGRILLKEKDRLLMMIVEERVQKLPAQ